MAMPKASSWSVGLWGGYSLIATILQLAVLLSNMPPQTTSPTTLPRRGSSHSFYRYKKTSGSLTTAARLPETNSVKTTNPNLNK